MASLFGPARGLTVEASTSPCAHICRYCSIGDRGGKFPLERWMAFVERCQDWAKTEGPPEFEIQGGFPGPSYNFDLPDFVALQEWYERTLGHRIGWIPLGGLKMRSRADGARLVARAPGRRGVTGVWASFVGTHGTHDRWNGRHGDFDFLLQTLRSAAELGLKHAATLFVTKSSLPPPG